MNTENSWYGVEAKKEGFPVLLRLRHLNPRPEFPILFVISWPYPQDNATRMPPPGFYAKIADFERGAIDRIEPEQLGIYVATQTGLGKIQYYIYTNSPELLAQFFDGHLSTNDPVEFASASDPNWTEYNKLIELPGI